MLLNQLDNPIRYFDDELIDGPILELGCGQSPFILEYCQTGREIFAVDNDQYQLDELKSRLLELNNESNVHFIQSTILKDELPVNKYSLVIMSNILHFFSLSDCSILIDKLTSHTVRGTLIYTLCHSTTHPNNDPLNSDNNEYFKHYFSEKDLQGLFPENDYDRIYFADIQKATSRFDVSIMRKWLNKVIDRNDKNKEADIQEYIDANGTQADLICIYRKK